ncbi:Transcription elongation factor spt5 [Gossypium arboreum]|uniref:Transcription elongation factor spt5 n=1 Tax=Gossypium arboreum TaxID=29729 RepID=A0A0B0PFU9_GOSAR|nr:Transcription elongation factor spt5 [Gossypium arboreum]
MVLDGEKSVQIISQRLARQKSTAAPQGRKPERFKLDTADTVSYFQLQSKSTKLLPTRHSPTV